MDYKQLSFKDYIKQTICGTTSCKDCTCRTCLYYYKGECPYGSCYDNYRAEHNPYNACHTDKRESWSNWKEEQGFWCRGGTFYPNHYCEHFKKYEGCVVKTCLKANVIVFQDGDIECSLLENFGCEKCYEEFNKTQERNQDDI